jgi:hypothetical protein
MINHQIEINVNNYVEIELTAKGRLFLMESEVSNGNS